jgi:hypothetical protein
MSPEQLSGHRVDGGSDVYSLGTVLYECLAGEPPFSGPPPALLYRIVHEPPPSLVSRGVPVSPELDAIVLACLAKDPGGRPRSGERLAAALKAQLERASGSVAVPAPAADRRRSGRRRPSSRRRWPALAAGLALAALLLLISMPTREKRNRNDAGTCSRPDPGGAAQGTGALGQSGEPEARPLDRRTSPARVPRPSHREPAAGRTGAGGRRDRRRVPGERGDLRPEGLARGRLEEDQRHDVVARAPHGHCPPRRPDPGRGRGSRRRRGPSRDLRSVARALDAHAAAGRAPSAPHVDVAPRRPSARRRRVRPRAPLRRRDLRSASGSPRLLRRAIKTPRRPPGRRSPPPRSYRRGGRRSPCR